MRTDLKTGRYLFENIQGHRFDRLVVTNVSHRDSRGGYHWFCVCDCGTIITRRADYLRRAKNQSCGCLAREIARETRIRTGTTHGLSGTPTGNSWMAMMDRCFNKRSKDWNRYGGAGRTVCEFIKATPLNLVLLIGHRPKNKSIDRIDNGGSYTCGACAQCLRRGWKMNVRWATPKEQMEYLKCRS